MAVSGNPSVFTTLTRGPSYHTRTSFPCPSQGNQSCFPIRGIKFNDMQVKKFDSAPTCMDVRCQSKLAFRMSEDSDPSMKSISQDVENLLLNAINMNFFDRLSLAWKIVFPSQRLKNSSNANIAKQRLKMILFSDRCAVSDDAKQKIVRNIVKSLSDFVEIESQENVELNVSTDVSLGTVYSVTVPVRRVKPGYQEADDGSGSITNIEYKDTGDTSGSVDVRFDFYVPDDKIQ